MKPFDIDVIWKKRKDYKCKQSLYNLLNVKIAEAIDRDIMLEGISIIIYFRNYEDYLIKQVLNAYENCKYYVDFEYTDKKDGFKVGIYWDKRD